MTGKELRNLQEAYLEIYQEIDEDSASYSRRQANKQARGREGKTPLQVTRTTKKIERSPEGKLEVKKTTEKKVNPKASVGKFKQNPTNLPSVQGGGHGGAGFGYGPHKHGTGGVDRGKKKGEQTKTSEPKLNKFQRKAALAKSKHYRTGGDTMQGGFVGDRAAKKIRAKARKSFGAWSKDVKEEFDVYDIVLAYLLDEGYAETIDSAEVIMANMSQDWINDICEISEAMSEDEKEMRRLAAQERRSGKSDRMSAKAAATYADSEAKSASKEDKKSRGKHIHGMADSYEVDGDLVESYWDPVTKKIGDVKRTGTDPEIQKMAAIAATKKKKRIPLGQGRTKAEFTPSSREQAKADMARWGDYWRSKNEEYVGEETITERELDPAETREKERLVKGLKKSAKDFKARYGERAKSVMYATATKMAKEK